MHLYGSAALPIPPPSNMNLDTMNDSFYTFHFSERKSDLLSDVTQRADAAIKAALIIVFGSTYSATAAGENREHPN